VPLAAFEKSTSTSTQVPAVGAEVVGVGSDDVGGCRFGGPTLTGDGTCGTGVGAGPGEGRGARFGACLGVGAGDGFEAGLGAGLEGLIGDGAC
jgi:hypothetical protein